VHECADHLVSIGQLGGNNLVLRTILGRTPRSHDDYFSELADSGR
jgi:hypothetical protein